MKHLYIVDYWVPFPASDGGGIVVLIAENDTEAFDLLANEPMFDPTYQDRIMERVINAQRFKLAEDFESEIIEAFTT